MSIHKRLEELAITLVTPPASVANYVGYKIVEDIVIISGQLPIRDGHVAYKGKLGGDVSLEEGQAAARQCGINILCQLQAACGGDLSKVAECVRLGGFVNCVDTFTDQPKVINGASDLMFEVFGEIGRHARAAVGVNSLPLGAAVEVEAMFRLR